LEANQNLPKELSKKDFPNALMLITINSPPAKCNKPEHIVAINAQKYLFTKKERKKNKLLKGKSVPLPLCHMLR